MPGPSLLVKVVTASATPLFKLVKYCFQRRDTEHNSSFTPYLNWDPDASWTDDPGRTFFNIVSKEYWTKL